MNRSGGLARTPLSALVFAALAGCASRLAVAQGQFGEGRYPDAERSFAALEPESRTWGSAERARYALYRGLTYAALGDRRSASPWLREAKAIEAAHPGSLSHDDVARLWISFESAGVE